MTTRRIALPSSLLLALVTACGDDDGGAPAGDARPRPDARAPSDAGGGSDDDAGPDDPVDAAPTGFSPADLAGLVLWLDGDRGVVMASANVVGWDDQSPLGNDAFSLINNRRPAPSPDEINGHRAIRFDGVDDVMTVLDDPSVRFGTGDFTIAVVLAYPELSSSTECLFNKQNLPDPFEGIYVFRHATGRLASKVSSDEPELVLDATTLEPHLMVFRRRLDIISLVVDGVGEVEATSQPINVSAPGIDIAIGSRIPDPLHDYQGDIAEIVAVSGATSAAESTALSAYLADKYAIVLAR